MDRGFPGTIRLHTSPEFRRVQDGGRRFSGKSLVLLALRRAPGPARFGLTASRRVGPAVARNLLKRRLREIIRHHRDLFRDGFDLVIIGRPGAARAGFADLAEELLRLARAGKVLLDGPAPGEAPGKPGKEGREK